MEFWKGKKVLVTGHTGFKGSWLCRTLVNAGAEVTGYALVPPTEPALFDLAGLKDRMTSVIGDIRDMAHLKETFDAAQPATPGLTVNGTLNVANGVTVEIANTNLLTRGVIHTLATSSTPFPSGLQSNLPKPWCVFLTNGGKTLKMCYQEGTMLLIK